MNADGQFTRENERSLKKKVRCFARPRPIRLFRALGVQSQTDRRYIRLEVDPDVDGHCPEVAPIYIPIEEFTDQKAVVARLVSSGEFVPFPRSINHAISSALEVTQFEPCVLHERPGYTANRYSFRDGSSVKVDLKDLGSRVRSEIPLLGLDVTNDRDGEVAFPAASWRSIKAGSVDSYCAGLTPLLAGQDILIFCLALGFVAPLLRWSSLQGSIGFSLVGRSGSEMTVALQLASSVFGKPDSDGELERENDLHTHLRTELPSANDHLLAMPELDRWFALLSEAHQIAGIRAIADAFNHNLESPSGIFPRTRTVMLTTSAKPVEDYCPDPEGARTLLDKQLLTIPLADRTIEREPALPSGIASKTALWRAVSAQVLEHHGAAGRRFVRKLLRQGLADERGFRLQLDTLVEEFVGAAGIEANDDVGAELAAKFGLVDAAATIAKQFGAFPEALDTRQPILQCFRLHRALPTRVSFISRLRGLLENEKLIDLGEKNRIKKVSDEQRADALLYTQRTNGKLKIYIRDSDKYRVFPDWNQIIGDAEFKAAHCRSRERDKVTGEVRSRNMIYATLGKDRKKERVWSFELSEEIPSN